MLPACIVVAEGHVSTGIAMCIGLLPVGLAGMRPGRRGRIVAVSAGVLFAAFLLVGSAISQLAWLAVIGMFTIPFLASSAVRPTLRRLALALPVPAVSVGLSFGEIDDALSLAWAIVDRCALDDGHLAPLAGTMPGAAGPRTGDDRGAGENLGAHARWRGRNGDPRRRACQLLARGLGAHGGAARDATAA